VYGAPPSVRAVSAAKARPSSRTREAVARLHHPLPRVRQQGSNFGPPAAGAPSALVPRRPVRAGALCDTHSYALKVCRDWHTDTLTAAFRKVPRQSARQERAGVVILFFFLRHDRG
jgi:hypothetical protein